MGERVLVVVEDYGLNGAAVIGVFTESHREAAELLAAIEPGRGTTGYGGTEVIEIEVDALPCLDLRTSDLTWRRRNARMRCWLNRWKELGGEIEWSNDG